MILKNNFLLEALDEQYCTDDVAFARRFITDHTPMNDADAEIHTPIKYIRGTGWVIYDTSTGTWPLPISQKESMIDVLKYLDDTYLNFKICVKKDLAEAKQKGDLDLNAKSKADFLTNLKIPAKTDGKYRGILNQAAGIPGAALDLADFDKIDENDRLSYQSINTPSGIIDLKTGECFPHSHKMHLTKCTSVSVPKEYHLKNGHSLWLDTVREILPDDDVRQWFQTMMGYCLLKIKPMELFLVLWGPGGNGKTTLMQTIAAALGPDFVGMVQTKTLMLAKRQMEGDVASPGIAGLRGKLIGQLSEAKDNDVFDVAQIKDIVSSRDITARMLHSNPITFRPTFQIILDTNSIPRVTNALDLAFRRRLIIVPFEQTFNTHSTDFNLKEKLAEKEQLEDCLKWLIEGAQNFLSSGLKIGQYGEELPKKMRELLDKYYQENDYLKQFILDACVLGAEEIVSAKDFYQAFVNWYRENWSSITPAHRTISKMLVGHTYMLPDGTQKVTIVKRRRKDGQVYLGIALKA